MIVTIYPPTKIDPAIGRVLPLHFVSKMCAELAPGKIKKVRAAFVYSLICGSPACFLLKEREIVIDVLADEELLRMTREQHFPEIELSDIWRALFIHEIHHAADPSASETECDLFAKTWISSFRF